MNIKVLLLSVSCLVIGFAAAFTLYSDKKPGKTTVSDKASQSIEVIDVYTTDGDGRLESLENEIYLIKQQMQEMEFAIDTLAQTTQTSEVKTSLTSSAANRYTSNYNQRIYNVDNLIRGGVDPGFAEDIVRRKNAIELKRLELQDSATRNNYLNTQRYIDELEDINQFDVNLREELGDELYDEYLFNSKQNNRVRISSIMLGSPAEQAGIEKGDIVLSYDNIKMYTWQELKEATALGELGDYVSLSVYRNGEIYSFSVPRGTLGMQLGATRLAP